MKSFTELETYISADDEKAANKFAAEKIRDYKGRKETAEIRLKHIEDKLITLEEEINNGEFLKKYVENNNNNNYGRDD